MIVQVCRRPAADSHPVLPSAQVVQFGCGPGFTSRDDGDILNKATNVVLDYLFRLIGIGPA